MTNLHPLKIATVTLVAMLSLSGGSLSAQNSFLSEQRHEDARITPLTGHKTDHKGLYVNPTPQSMAILWDKTLDVGAGFSVKDDGNSFSADLAFLKQNPKGVRVTISFGEKVYTGKAPKAGAYKFIADKKGIRINGFDESGAFYGIQTLRQILESEALKDGKMPYITIDDYPDLPVRGVVEGFYGTPWSHKVRLSLIDFHGRHKMNTYIYGPKDDPYHSSPNWRKPYPQKESSNIRELVEACRRNRVDFVWALHPGLDLKWTEEDYQNIVRKFENMYSLGVRSFAIFFDDIEGDATDAVKHAELMNRLNREFVQVKGDVTPLTMCPTEYTKLWADPSDNGELVVLGKSIDPSVRLFWTGDVICSDLTKETMDWVNSRIKRPAFYWWNFPVTDYATHIVMQGPTYGVDNTLTDNDLCGLVTNPMEYGESSKLALYGVADYSWNIADYDPIDNWERGLVELVPDAAGAYRTFAIHSCDTENGYRREESWESETFRFSEYTPEKDARLRPDFVAMTKAPATMRGNCKNGLLLKELDPWLTELGLLGERCLDVLDLMSSFGRLSDADFWKGYTAALMTDEGLKSYNAHKSGSLKIQPFYETALDDMSAAFYKKITGSAPRLYDRIGTFPSLETPMWKNMTDDDPQTYYRSVAYQQTGDWIGLDLGSVTPVDYVKVVQGQDDKADKDFFDRFILEYSLDKEQWTALTQEQSGSLVTIWSGAPVQARYVRLRNVETVTPGRRRGCVRTFSVNPITPERLGFRLSSYDNDAACRAFDRNLSSSFQSYGSFSFGVDSSVRSCKLLARLKEGDSIKLRLLDADGTCLGEKISSEPFTRADIVPGTETVEIIGSAEIFEIIL